MQETMNWQISYWVIYIRNDNQFSPAARIRCATSRFGRTPYAKYPN